VIFATVGSHPTFAFERLLRGLEAAALDDLVVQYGPGAPPAGASRAVAWMSLPEVLETMDRADHVISHAGVGTVLCATRAGHVPVVVPRLRRHGETVDDHQLDLGRALAETGRLVLVEDVGELGAALGQAPARGASTALDGTELISAVRAELTQSSAR